MDPDPLTEVAEEPDFVDRLADELSKLGFDVNITRHGPEPGVDELRARFARPSTP